MCWSHFMFVFIKKPDSRFPTPLESGFEISTIRLNKDTATICQPKGVGGKVGFMLLSLMLYFNYKEVLWIV